MDVRMLPSENYQALKFIITQTMPAFTNALRRIILTDVKTLAIEEIIMVENNTAMFDEYIAHRLGLIPLNSDIDDLNIQEDCPECNGAGCNACTVTLTLTQETGLNETDVMILSGDLIANDHRVYPIYDEVPIMVMGRNQRLILEAVARFGTGKEHAKWQPTASLGYQYMPTIAIKPGSKLKKEVADACPRDVLEFDENNHSINIKNLLNCNLCMECQETAGDDSIKVTGDPSQIIFFIESTGSLPVESIITEASDILRYKAENFIESLNKALEVARSDPTSMRKISTFERISVNE